MGTIKVAVLAMFIAMGLLSFAHAGQIPVASVTASGPYYNNTNLLIDGYIPGEGTAWTAGTNVYWNGTGTGFSLDFNKIYHLESMVLQVDNNDRYGVMYSTDNVNWFNLFVIEVYHGNVTWGMDTFYIPPEIGFTPVDARYIRFSALGGDNMYAVSEIQAFGTSSAVPEPVTMVLLGIGLTGILGLRRKLN